MRMASPPWLRLSVRAAAIVLPNRYCIGMPRTTRGTAAAVEVVGKQVWRERRQDVLHGAVLVHVPRDPQRRELAHLVGAGDRAAEDQDRQPALVELPDGTDQVHSGGVRQAQVEDDQIDMIDVGADPRQQFGRALDRYGLVSRALERGAKAVADERRIVGDNDGFGGDRGVGHLGGSIGTRRSGPQAALQICARSRYNPNSRDRARRADSGT